ncbi:MAG TPA: 5-formyltetrahydrofolate cyclo-ligase [Nocardioides sp.]|uniref:5-formyltetrahydrofolate cyclo-ligase n=1 Tax=Nocardioides sp. TaxID=35761 RepID=UPI002F423D26
MAKIALRDQIRTSRNRLSVAELGSLGRDLAEVVTTHPVVRRAATLTAYVSIGTEPATGALLESLAAMGKRVILPIVLPGMDLDWGTWRGPTSLAPARYGLLEPVDRLGVDAIATADVVLVPGQAVSGTGYRLGQGGGCYDRALTRVPVGTPIVCLLYDEEVGRDVPVDDHDRPVTSVATPTRWLDLRG